MERTEESPSDLYLLSVLSSWDTKRAHAHCEFDVMVWYELLLCNHGSISLLHRYYNSVSVDWRNILQNSKNALYLQKYYSMGSLWFIEREIYVRFITWET